jgi:cyanophycinase-like exopeptidase
MILGTEMPDVRAAGIRSTIAFGILPISSLLPHFNAMPLFGKPLIASLRRRLREGEIMIGVDEDTAIVGKRNEEWTVMGKSKAHVFTKDESHSYAVGEKFSLERNS